MTFDETLPATWEWDVKRLGASIVIAGRSNGFTAAQNRAATMATVRGYREWLARYAAMRLVGVWYAKITEADITALFDAAGSTKSADRRKRLDAVLSGARARHAGRLTPPLQSSLRKTGASQLA